MATAPRNQATKSLLEEDEHLASKSDNGISSARDVEEVSHKLKFPHVTIAVIGQEKAGKSTFIQSALDLKTPLSSRSTTKKMSLDGTVYIVRLVEICSKDIMIGTRGELQWPRLGSDSSSHTIDGALVLHDVTQPAAFSGLTGLLDSFTKSSLPFVLIASKCDVHSQNGPPQPTLGNYEIHRPSPESPKSQKMCMALVLRSVISQKCDSIDLLNDQLDQGTFSDLHNRPRSQDRHHTRANSEVPKAAFNGAAGGSSSTGTFESGVDGYGDDRYPTDQNNSPNLASNPHNLRYARSNSFPVRPHTPPSGAALKSRRPSASGESSPAKNRNRQQRLHSAWRNSGGSDAFNSFLDMEDDAEGARSAPSSPGGSSKAKSTSDGTFSDTGYTFDELVDRLIAQPMSKQDSKFSSIFLCLYRKFAAPASLLNALINRFERNEKNISDQLTRIADQLRLLNVMAQWVSEYPGDVDYPKTRKRIMDFVSTLEKSHFYMFAAKEIGSYLEMNVEDDDVGWPFRDGDVEEFDDQDIFYVNSGRSSPSMYLGGPISHEEQAENEEQEEEEDPIYNMSALDLSEGSTEPNTRLSGTSSVMDKPGTILSQSYPLLSLEAAQREAQNLELTPSMSLTKMQWRLFMEIPDEDFAHELTRIDWIMFNSFRPRDLVRHVSISGPDKDKIQSLKHVNRMIKQFNHIAFFVASMILFRDKPKHRASAMEKFMNIAQKLRRLNNYNSLGALIAGINGTPVHRLAQTRELVPVQTQKEFMRLVILMSTQKSHFAYRLAWDNSFSERIPFLPLHRRDLVSAEEGNKTFIGDNRSRINWKKFEVMGEVILGIQRSQKIPYAHMHQYEDVQRLILDIKLSGDEEDLYARSIQVEPGTGADTGRKKFSWLRS
ncbi:putative Ras guanyl-nucleotide exchange factor RasGEF [Aspergillus clavatus NRRL 1]|uniref:Ras guanyl-nucleotide exchange factor RasGEF, putative n=1 Tax=Aspergillus clavatus (strain ATCC 1007 / CBS 513.65 / DSM 816 / NCTC 3887 / NRRL 1 / QM 1276 / 107) TaxID=344612 RepID=A1CRJ4_ASPCL|nr:Ras guanyl-nucleotide exchange factor RasGEF, putative [Aspergillus clavatus NRRL 1]EAW08265.1 Ras guanyl-nucleotide exchange factor RasGEF, putative [Aspergillus clavatus NRRL 1]